MNIHWVCSRPINVHPVLYCVIAFYIDPLEAYESTELVGRVLRSNGEFVGLCSRSNTFRIRCFSLLCGHWPSDFWNRASAHAYACLDMWGAEDNIEQIMIRRLEALSRTCQLWRLLSANPFSIWMRRSVQSVEYTVSNSSAHTMIQEAYCTET